MKKGLLWFGFGLAGFALALGLSIGAFALTGAEFRSPARPLIHTEREVKGSVTPSPSRPPRRSHHHENQTGRSPTPRPTVAPVTAPPVPASPSPTDGGGEHHHEPSDD
jgi:hypothetical protein